MDTIIITPELMHNWPHHRDDFLCNQLLPANVKAAMDLQHKEHSRGLSVRESAKKICSKYPTYLQMGF